MSLIIPDGYVAVWRVEHKETGKGPCTDINANSILLRHRADRRVWIEPEEDPAIAPDWKKAGGACGGTCFRFGVATPYEIYEWFHRWTCNDLHDVGFELAVYLVPQAKARIGKTQIMFPHGSEGVTKAAVYSLYNFIANPELEDFF